MEEHTSQHTKAKEKGVCAKKECGKKRLSLNDENRNGTARGERIRRNSGGGRVREGVEVAEE